MVGHELSGSFGGGGAVCDGKAEVWASPASLERRGVDTGFGWWGGRGRGSFKDVWCLGPSGVLHLRGGERTVRPFKVCPVAQRSRQSVQLLLDRCTLKPCFQEASVGWRALQDTVSLERGLQVPANSHRAQGVKAGEGSEFKVILSFVHSV